MAKKAQKKVGGLKPAQFMVWVTLPKSERANLRGAAGQLELPMSEFARRAILEAIRRVKVGKPPWED